MKMHRIIADLAEAVTFLTRYPLPGFLFQHPPSGAKAAWAFPLAGAIAAFLPAVLLGLLNMSEGHALLASLIAVALYAMATGALHEDGLADAADGLFGGRTRDDALRIMKDSATGSYGVLALIVSVGLRAGALAGLTEAHGAVSALVLIAAATCARAGMIWHWYLLPPARTNGAAAALGRPGFSALTIATLTAAIVIAAIAVGLTMTTGSLIAIILVVVAVGVFSRFVRKRIGGHTGDTLGASAQIGETVFLATLAIVS